MEIDKILVLSTDHIKKDTASWLDREPDELIIYSKKSYGWFIYANAVNDDKIIERIPSELLTILQMAVKNGCTWVCLDRDAYEVEGLPKYEW